MDTTAKTQSMLNQVLDYLNITESNYVLKIGAFIMVLCAATLLFFYLMKTKVIRNSAMEALNYIALRGRYQDKKTVAYEKKESFPVRWQNLFTYSRMNKLFPFLTAELWLIAVVVFGTAGCIISSMVTPNLFENLIVMFAIIGVMMGFEYFLAYRNFQKTDADLLRFLNMLGNFSVTSGEITGIFRQVAKYMNDPMRTALLECYNEAQTRGNTIVAMRSLAAKIEHPKFKEIIRNLEATISYSADYNTIVSGNRRVVQEYMRAKQERKNKSYENTVTIILMTFAIGALIGLAGMLVEVDAWAILFGQPIGHLVIGIIALCYVYLVWKNYSINK